MEDGENVETNTEETEQPDDEDSAREASCDDVVEEKGDRVEKNDAGEKTVFLATLYI